MSQQEQQQQQQDTNYQPHFRPGEELLKKIQATPPSGDEYL